VDRELEVIRDEMEQTRANLADKLGALENQVRETVSSASETVTSTVEGVKEVVGSVSETVGDVTEALNVPKQIEQHPWAAIGIALAAGCTVGYLLSGSRHPQPRYEPRPEPRPQPMPDLSLQQVTPTPMPAATLPPTPMPTAPEPEHHEGLLDKAKELLPDMDSVMPHLKEIGNTVISGLGGLAVGSLMSVIRELASQNLPQEWKGEVSNLVDQVTRQLGGKVQQVKEEPKPAETQQHPAEPKPNEPKPQQSPPNDTRGQRNPRNQMAYQG